MVVVPIANLSAVVTGAVDAAMAVARDALPAALTRDAVVEATRASAAWLMHHLWTWFAIARAFAADNLPAGAAAVEASAAWLTSHLWTWFTIARAFAAENLPAGAAAVEASAGPWIQSAARLLRGLYGWLVTAAVQKLPDVAAEKLLGDIVEGHRVVVYATLALVLLAVAFLGGAVWALTCRTMKAPGLRGARVPRAVFEANPKRYYATVRSARKARRGASRTGCSSMLPAGLLIAFLAYLVAKVLR